MKRLAPLLVLLLLIACSQEELPPSPPAPGNVGVGSAIAGLAGTMPKWAAEAQNVAITPMEADFGDGLVVSVTNFDYVYSNGYFFNSKLRTWEKFPLAGEAAKDWIKGQAIGSVQVDANKFADGDNYVVVYACTKLGSSWECNNQKWMLASFKVKSQKTGVIPEAAFIDEMVINKDIKPFTVIGTLAEKDNFLEINVTRYDAKYREPSALVVLVHVFDFKTRAEVEKTIKDPQLFKTIIINGWKVHNGNNMALFLSEEDHRIAIWSSGTKIVYVETFDSASANKEIVDAYVKKYPSDLKKPV